MRTVRFHPKWHCWLSKSVSLKISCFLLNSRFFSVSDGCEWSAGRRQQFCIFQEETGNDQKHKKAVKSAISRLFWWDALTKKIPAENENSGSGFDLFSFLHCDFSIFAFGCPASKKEGSHENVVWILSSLSRKRGRNLDVSFLSSKFRPLFKKQLRQNEWEVTFVKGRYECYTVYSDIANDNNCHTNNPLLCSWIHFVAMGFTHNLICDPICRKALCD